MSTETAPTLIDRLRVALDPAELTAEPYWLGHAAPDSAVIRHADGYIVITPSDDAAYRYVLGVYDVEGWEQLGEHSGDLADIATTDDAVAMVAYLTTCQPEGTDWSAWAGQRLADDGADANR